MKGAVTLGALSAVTLSACMPLVQNHLPPKINMPATSICSLVGPSAPANGTKIRIRGFFLTDYLERSAVTASACPDVQLGLYLDKSVTKQETHRYEDIEKSLMVDYIEDHRTGVYWVDVIGRFVVDNNDTPHLAIYADRIWSFKRLPCTAFYTDGCKM